MKFALDSYYIILYHEFSFNPHKQAVIIISSILPIMFIHYIMQKSSEINHLHSKIIQNHPKSSKNHPKSSKYHPKIIQNHPKIIQNHPIFTCFSLTMEPMGLQPRRTTHCAPGFTSQLRHLHARGSELSLISDFTSRGRFHQEN